MTDAYQQYKDATFRIVERISSLAARFPSLAGASAETLSFVKDTEHWIRQTLAGQWNGAMLARWDHKFGPRETVPNPHYNPNIPFTAVAPMKEVLGPGALELILFFEVERERNSRRGGLVVRVGAMNVYVLVSASEPPLQAEITKAIQLILEEEQRTFQNLS